MERTEMDQGVITESRGVTEQTGIVKASENAEAKDGENKKKKVERTPEEWAQLNAEWARNKEASRKMAEKIAQKKTRMVNQPNAMIVQVRTIEGHRLIKVVMGLDKVINRLRLAAGNIIRISDTVDLMQKVSDVFYDLEQVTASMGRDNNHAPMLYDLSPEEKLTLAARRSSYVFVPRTEECKRATATLQKLDARLVQIRTTSTNFATIEDTLEKISHVTHAMNHVGIEIAQVFPPKLKVFYYTPKGLDGYIPPQVG